MKKQHLFYIDVIKVISALAIILFHLNVHSFYGNNSAKLLGGLSYFNVSFGDIFISLFIIISGLTLSLIERNKFIISDFFKKRFLAIYPSFWISYIFIAILFFLLDKSFGDGQYWKILLSIIGLDGLFLYKFPSYYLVGEWYTGYMLITYFFFPILYIMTHKRPILLGVIILTFCVVLHINYEKLFQMPETINPLMRIPDFLFGIFFSLYLSKMQLLRNILFILSIIYLVFSDLLFGLLPYHFHMVIVGVAIFIILEKIINLLRIEKVNVVKDIFIYLSKYTFLAFLVHHQILLLFFNYIPNLPNENLIFKFSVFVSVSFLSFSYAILIFPIVCTLSRMLSNKLFYIR